MIEDVQKYLKARRRLDIIHGRVLEAHVSKQHLLRAAQDLGMREGPNGICCADQNDESILSDFAEYESWAGKPSPMNCYLDAATPADDLEAELMIGLRACGTMLFGIFEVDKARSRIILRNITNPVVDIPLIDINMASTAVPGLLLFTRLIPMPHFTMTSGVSFVYLPEDGKFLLELTRRKIEKIRDEALRPRKRFLLFYKYRNISGIKSDYSEPCPAPPQPARKRPRWMS